MRNRESKKDRIVPLVYGNMSMKLIGRISPVEFGNIRKMLTPLSLLFGIFCCQLAICHVRTERKSANVTENLIDASEHKSKFIVIY